MSEPKRLLKFEKIETQGLENATTGPALPFFRARILGGWLVSMQVEKGYHSFFVPDSIHLWDGNSFP
jgi:hypothetical protein